MVINSGGGGGCDQADDGALSIYRLAILLLVFSCGDSVPLSIIYIVGVTICLHLIFTITKRAELRVVHDYYIILIKMRLKCEC